MDLLASGVDNAANYYCRLYRHNAATQKFTFAYDFTGVRYGSTSWGDYDNNGDLDLYLTGQDQSGAVIGRLYRNNSATTNTLPNPPTNLSASYPNNSRVVLNWTKPTDNENPQGVLTYNVMVGTALNSFDIIAPMSILSGEYRLIPAPGNAGTSSAGTNPIGQYILNSGKLGLTPGVTYYWQVQTVDNIYTGSIFMTGTFSIPVTKTAGTDSVADILPQTFALSQNYPNPFWSEATSRFAGNPSTRLNLDLPENGHVKAIVYNLMGQEVARLRDEQMTAGYRHLDWDGKNKAGATVSSGTYLMKVVFEGGSGDRKESTSRVQLLK